MAGRPQRVFNRAATRPDTTGRDWVRIITNAAMPDTAEVWIFDEIGMFGITASDFARQLKALKANSIDVYLNSPGGEVYDGMAIHNALRSHAANVIVHVEGVAASIASVIAMAGDKVIMAPNATMMIHEGHMVAVGNSQDMRKAAELLDKVSDQIAQVYADKTGQTPAVWRDRMKNETWYNAAEAVKAGLADEVAKPRPRNSMPLSTWDMTVFNYAGRTAAPPPPPLPKAMACPIHHTATDDGVWDAGANVGRLESPMSVATAKAAFGWYDSEAVDNGMMPKGAGKFPHHDVSADGKPGAANLNAVRNGLARLSQSDVPQADQDAVRAHLHAHLSDAQSAAAVSPARPQAALSTADVSMVSQAMGWFTAIDSIVDEAQETIADYLGVPDPDADEAADDVPAVASGPRAALSTQDLSAVSQALGWFTAVDNIVEEAQEALATYLGVPNPDPDAGDDMASAMARLGDLIQAAVNPPANPVDVDAFQVGMGAAAANAPAPPDGPPALDFGALFAARPAVVEAFGAAIVSTLGPLQPPDPELFDAAMRLAAAQAPAPPTATIVVPEVVPLPSFDPTMFDKALREAMQ